MLVVVATTHDPDSLSLVARWTEQGAALLSCEDLSVSGWRHYLADGARSVAMIGGRAVSTEEINGVLTRWPGVYPQELSNVVADDRPYVASEMTAFLRSWLHQLKCPVLNRPSNTDLAGPGWRPEQWVYAAARIGIPVRPIKRRVARNGTSAAKPNLPHTTVTVVGKKCFGDVDSALAERARLLADAASVQLLAVHFEGPDRNSRLLTADSMPVLSDEVADAVLNYFLDPTARS